MFFVAMSAHSAHKRQGTNIDCDTAILRGKVYDTHFHLPRSLHAMGLNDHNQKRDGPPELNALVDLAKLWLLEALASRHNDQPCANEAMYCCFIACNYGIRCGCQPARSVSRGHW